MTKAGQRSLQIAKLPEDRLVRRDRLRFGFAFGAAVLLHASTALSLVYWEPAEPVVPPGEMMITVDLAAAASQSQADQAGLAKETAVETPQPPTPPEEEVKEEEEVVEEPLPEPEPELKEEIAEVPKDEKAEVVIAPKPKKQAKKKPKPKPTPPTQAAAAATEKPSDVSGRGASGSATELNAYKARVRSAIERRKGRPASAGSGTVHLAFTVTRTGGVIGLRLSRSSGDSAIDSAARAAVASAGIPPIPEALPATIPFTLPMNFR